MELLVFLFIVLKSERKKDVHREKEWKRTLYSHGRAIKLSSMNNKTKIAYCQVCVSVCVQKVKETIITKETIS